MATKSQLRNLVHENLGERRLIVVSNREPFVHDWARNEVVCSRPAGGLVSAMHPVMAATGGRWIALASGTADYHTADREGHIAVPPEDPAYILRRVWIPERIRRQFYDGLANRGLWPLCHNVYQRPRFSTAEWESYRMVNAHFAEAVLEEAGDGSALVFIQDYHFGLLPRMLKDRNPRLMVAQFWHIPWPSADVFSVFPWKEELLEGLLGNDLLGFHLPQHCGHFLDVVDCTLEAQVDREAGTVEVNGDATTVQPFPIGIDFREHGNIACSPKVEMAMRTWKSRLGPHIRVGIGIDRIDYTKGIPERIRALDLFLQRHPEWREKLVFVQVGVPSRGSIPEYGELAGAIEQEIAEVNARWRTDGWEPILFVHRALPPEDMIALHRLAAFCMVTSLHDGMNLVAKEFIASRFDVDGVLVLSRFAGAAEELNSAVLVNPFCEDSLAGGIHTALTLSPAERTIRMSRMRAKVEKNNVYRWAGEIFSTLLGLQGHDVSAAMRPEREMYAARVSTAGASLI